MMDLRVKTLKKPIILVAANGFWSMRETLDEEVFEGEFELVYAMNFEILPEDKELVIAVVIADQPFGGKRMDEFPNLKTIARTGTGYDNIDIAAAYSRSIIVTRVAMLNAESVSEFTIALILMLSRNMARANNEMLNLVWDRKTSGLLLTEMTIGFIGLGAIGRSLCRKLYHLGAKRLIGCNRTLRKEVQELVDQCRLELVEIPKVMQESDLIVIGLALVPETKCILNAKMLSLMKPTAFLINIGRGALVDEDALAKLVEKGKIAGVALDVFSVEPPTGDTFSLSFVKRLVQSYKEGRNVILTPHNAAVTNNSTRNISIRVAQNIINVLANNLKDAEIV